MATKINDSALEKTYNNVKVVEYDYDLISGNVNKVIYQKDQKDQFIHKYEYDADNRIVNVQTSQNGVIWDTDASYNYYEHGPLARTIIGEKDVQGVDYVYTLQGWLKGVNGETLNPDNDFGKDGKANDIAKDAYGYSLSYYDGDYQPRKADKKDHFKVTTSTSLEHNTTNLYNGNIKAMVTNMQNLKNKALPTAYNHYQYDQLNRISSMNSNIISSNDIKNVHTSYKYDRNGNLTQLKRDALKRNKVVAMDNFTYHYPNGNNQLSVVEDAEPAKRFKSDIDDQIKQLAKVGITYDDDNKNTHNYVYDEIGQLVEDKTEGIEKIEWTVSGKVSKIIKKIPKTDYTQTISFAYDGLGNRISKTVVQAGKAAPTKTTYYVRDAQGNVLAVYKNTQRYTRKGVKSILKLEEQHIYGSSRLGVVNNNQKLKAPTNFVEREVYSNDFSTLKNIGDDNEWNLYGTSNVTIANEKLVIECDDKNEGMSYTMLTEANKEYTIQYAFTKQTSKGIKVEASLFGETLATKKHKNSGTYNLTFTAKGVITNIFWYRTSKRKKKKKNIETWTLDDVTVTAQTEEPIVEVVENVTRTIGKKRYELSNHLGNVINVVSDRKTVDYGGTKVYTTNFSTDIATWQASSSAISTSVENERLKIVTDAHLNGANGYYNLEADREYTINITVDKTEFTAPLEFSIWQGRSKVLGEFVENSKTISTTFIPTETRDYRLNFRLRESGYNGEAQTLYIDDVIITDNTTLDVTSISFNPEIIAYNDYYPFGMLMPNRHGQADSYRYGFQGQEKDDEIKGEGNSLNYKYRMHDPRIGRFFAVDPLAKSYPYMTPYQFSGNKPIWSREIEGLESEVDADDSVNEKHAKTHSQVIWKNPYLAKRAGSPYGNSIRTAANKFAGGGVSKAAKESILKADGPSKNPDEKDRGSTRGAFRHALWTAQMALEFSFSDAEFVTDAHEGIEVSTMDFSGKNMNSINSKLFRVDIMTDELNNREGKIYASIKKSKGGIKPYLMKETAKDLLKIYHEKGLYVITQNADKSYKVEKKKISKEDYKALLNRWNSLDDNGNDPVYKKQTEIIRFGEF